MAEEIQKNNALKCPKCGHVFFESVGANSTTRKVHLKRNKYRPNGIVGLILVLLFLTSCIGSDNKNVGSDNENTNSVEEQIDKQMVSHKQWEIGSNGAITLCSENYYVTDRGENIYGMIHFMETDEGKLSGLSFYVLGADENQPKTTFRFDNQQSAFMVSFNSGELLHWPFFAPPKETAMIGYYNEWEKQIRESEICEIRFKAEDTQMDFRFNTKGFPW